MRIYAIGYFEGDTYKVKRVKANTVAEAHEKANLDTPIVRIQREEYKDIGMAIEALKAPTENTNTPSDTPTDLIRRQDAIDTLKRVAGVGNRALDALKNIPTATDKGADE